MFKVLQHAIKTVQQLFGFDAIYFLNTSHILLYINQLDIWCNLCLLQGVIYTYKP